MMCALPLAAAATTKEKAAGKFGGLFRLLKEKGTAK